MGKLEGEINALKAQKLSLKRADEKADNFNKKLDKLVGEIRGNLGGYCVEEICAAVEDLKDTRAASETDSKIKGAIGNIDREIAVIDYAIKKQKEAARKAKMVVEGSGGR